MTTHNVKPLRRSAELRSVDRKARTVDLVWSTGAKVLRSSWLDGKFFEELSLDPNAVRLDRLNNGAPFLANHDSFNVADQPGVIVPGSARIANNEGLATIRFVAEGVDPEADKLFAKIADGIVRNVSVGYRTLKAEKIEAVDNTVPTIRAIDWEPYEVSAVSMGADAGAGFRSADDEATNVCEVINQRGAQPHNQRNAMDPEEIKRQEEAARIKREADAQAAKDIAQRAVKAERERIEGINHAVRAAGLDAEFGAKLIADGVALDAARGQVIDAMAERAAKDEINPHAPVVEVGATGDEKFRAAAVASMLGRMGGDVGVALRAAVSKGVDGFGPDTLKGDDSFKRFQLVDLAIETLRRRGFKFNSMNRADLVGHAFTYRAGGSGYQSTSDFAVILENTMHKVLRAAFATTPDTWRRFCGTDTVNDFRTHNRYQLGAMEELPVIPSNGEFTNGTIPDGSKKTIDIETRGRILAISRQLIINDDMGALADLGMAQGRSAALAIEKAVYALLAQNSGLGPTQDDGQPFFHSNRSNVNATGSALSVAGIDADWTVMAAQQDANGQEYLDLKPSRLLVPNSLRGAAMVINNSAYDFDGSALQKPNVVRDLFADVIPTARLTGTRRYLFAEPSVAAAILVVFMEGQGQGPVLESQDGWRTDGTELKVRMDFKAQMFEPKGAVTNAGA